MKTWGPYRGVVDRVVDGDTVHVKLDVGFDLTVYARVRVLGINAPELKTDAGKEARAFALSLLPVGSSVEFVSHDWDKFGGRVDGEVSWVDSEHVSHDLATEMLNAGHAVVYPG